MSVLDALSEFFYWVFIIGVQGDSYLYFSVEDMEL